MLDLSRFRALIAATLILSQPASKAFAIDIERLMMPGPVSQPHAEIENDCSKCHSPFDTGREAALCMFCHEEVSNDRSIGQGFHGRDRGAKRLACRSCHTEHKGREHDILGLDANSFDHDSTDYPLLGAHRAARCTSCHEIDAKTKYRDAPSDCYSCHETQDRHAGKLGQQCGECHGEDSWSGGKFDHSKTEYPLVGKHTSVQCGRCHPKEQYKGVPITCVGCHRIDDAHQGRFGNDCATCHSPESFKESSSFDHGKKTKFPLLERHAEIKCESCHVEPAEVVKLSVACNDCHQIVDVHHGLLGSACGDCHGSAEWKPATFDHGKAARFELRGAHATTECEGCHRTKPRKEDVLANCRSCHEGDDVHSGQLVSACSDCHSERSWTQKIFFDHDLGRFPLLGLHAALTCEACHTSSRFHDAKTDCLSCHAKDDTHKRALGTQCERCHNPNGWDIWTFDHDRQTEFPLRGAHEGLTCKACHTGSSSGDVRTSKDCYACHSRDDKHRGRFGRNCEACHDDKDWKNSRMMR